MRRFTRRWFNDDDLLSCSIPPLTSTDLHVRSFSWTPFGEELQFTTTCRTSRRRSGRGLPSISSDASMERRMKSRWSTLYCRNPTDPSLYGSGVLHTCENRSMSWSGFEFESVGDVRVSFSLWTVGKLTFFWCTFCLHIYLCTHTNAKNSTELKQ